MFPDPAAFGAPPEFVEPPRLVALVLPDDPPTLFDVEVPPPVPVAVLVPAPPAPLLQLAPAKLSIQVPERSMLRKQWVIMRVGLFR